MRLNLGVIDVPYKTGRGAVTTGDVAGWLEDKYGVMEVYFENRKEFIAKALEGSLAGALENALMGHAGTAPFGAATSAIEADFKQFLSTRKIESLGIAGVPTQAAIRGISHRRKRPRRRKISDFSEVRSRPSFIDTGQYQAAFKVWVS